MILQGFFGILSLLEIYITAIMLYKTNQSQDTRKTQLWSSS